MLDLTVGETLYYINKYTFDLEKATVCKVEDEFFSVTFYMGYKELKLYRTRFENKCLNTRLFKTKREAWDALDAAHSKQSKKPDDPFAPCSCDDCMLRCSGECTEIRNRICRFSSLFQSRAMKRLAGHAITELVSVIPLSLHRPRLMFIGGKFLLPYVVNGKMISCFTSCIYLTSPHMSKGRSLFSSFAFLVSSAASF